MYRGYAVTSCYFSVFFLYPCTSITSLQCVVHICNFRTIKRKRSLSFLNTVNSTHNLSRVWYVGSMYGNYITQCSTLKDLANPSLFTLEWKCLSEIINGLNWQKSHCFQVIWNPWTEYHPWRGECVEEEDGAKETERWSSSCPCPRPSCIIWKNAHLYM